MPLRDAAFLALALVLGVAACYAPDDARPGLRLSGPVKETPSDWSFTDAHQEIAIEVRTPYLLPHSVTIWCASLEGRLYVGARDPEEKWWPTWADRDPDVRLRIDGAIYEVRLEPLVDAERIRRVRAAYASKYDLPASPEGGPPSIRYWRVAPRS